MSVLSCLLFPEYTSKILKKERKKMFPITSKVTTDFLKRKLINGWIPFRGQHSNPLQYSCLAKNPHGQRRLAGYNPWGCRESDMTEWLSTEHHSKLHLIEKFTKSLILNLEKLKHCAQHQPFYSQLNGIENLRYEALKHSCNFILFSV